MSRNDKEGMSKRREKTIRLNRFGNTLTYDGANGKTVKNISVSQGDHTLYVYIAFTDDTEVAVHFNALPVADVTLCGDVHGDLELIAEYYSKQTPPLHTVARRSSFLSPN